MDLGIEHDPQDDKYALVGDFTLLKNMAEFNYYFEKTVTQKMTMTQTVCGCLIMKIRTPMHQIQRHVCLRSFLRTKTMNWCMWNNGSIRHTSTLAVSMMTVGNLWKRKECT